MAYTRAAKFPHWAMVAPPDSMPGVMRFGAHAGCVLPRSVLAWRGEWGLFAFIRRYGLLLVGLICGLAGCASVQNDALPRSFVVKGVDETGYGDISRWRDVVAKESACPEGMRGKSGVAFDRGGLPVPEPEALCRVSTAVRARHEVKVLLGAALDGEGGCPEGRPCLGREFREEWSALQLSPGDRPKLGVALSGGGPRSASFSIGVLKALYENERGFLVDTQYLSTVSGGGYATYWYLSQLANPDVWKKGHATPFADCYHREDMSGYPQHDEVLKNALEYEEKDLCKEGHRESFPFQAYLSGRTDMLADAEGSFASHVPEYAVKFYPLVGALASPLSGFQSSFWLPGFLTAVPHHLANTVMDWSWNGSFYGFVYRTGIHRTYGPLGTDARASEGCGEGIDQLGRKADGSHCLSYWPSGARGGKSLQELTANYWKDRNAYKRGADGGAVDELARPYPVWIINTQGVPANSLWNACSPGDLKRTLAEHNYEFTPFGYGSGLMGYFSRADDIPPGHKGPGPRLIPPAFVEPLAAVHASGAAVDSAGLSSKRQECLFRLIEQLGNFSLGLKLTNPVFEEGHRTMHRLMPWPLYYFDGDRDSPKSTEIYLSDGGHIDNLGLFSLIRRGVRTIVVFDASQDEDGVFEDLRETSRRLEEEGIGVRLRDLCWSDGRGTSPCAHDDSYVFNVCHGKKCGAADPHKKRFLPRDASRQIFVGGYFLTESPTRDLGRIIYVKSSLPQDWEKAPCDIHAKASFPCATKGYLLTPGKGADFPNTSTARIALDSSDKLYWAYRDLGIYLGHRAAVCVEGISRNPNLLSCDSADGTERPDLKR